MGVATKFTERIEDSESYEETMMSIKTRHRPARGRALRAQAGASLLEVLLASFLLLAISVFIVPLFTNSLSSTLAGGRSSELSTLTQQSIELITQRPMDHPDWDLNGDLCGTDPCVQEANPDHWYWPSAGGGTGTLGDEGWIDTTGDAEFHWRRTLTVRKYSIADVSSGTVDVTGTTLDTLGHPNLFDSPLDEDDGDLVYDVHFVEYRVNIRPDDDRALVDQQKDQEITISHLRAN